MSGSDNGSPRQLVVERGEAVVAVPFIENGREMVRYSVVTQPEPVPTDEIPESVRVALSLAGAWSDLDDDEMDGALWHIRHDSVPTPPMMTHDAGVSTVPFARHRRYHGDRWKEAV